MSINESSGVSINPYIQKNHRFLICRPVVQVHPGSRFNLKRIAFNAYSINYLSGIAFTIFCRTFLQKIVNILHVLANNKNKTAPDCSGTAGGEWRTKPAFNQPTLSGPLILRSEPGVCQWLRHRQMRQKHQSSSWHYRE